MTFGEKLRHLREERGFSQTDLAGITGFTRRSVYNWEKDKKQPKNIATLEVLSRALGVDLTYWWN